MESGVEQLAKRVFTRSEKGGEQGGVCGIGVEEGAIGRLKLPNEEREWALVPEVKKSSVKGEGAPRSGFCSRR